MAPDPHALSDPMDRQTLRVGLRVGLVFFALIALVMLATFLSPGARW